MTSHRFLIGDLKVEEVIYGDKYRMIANFDNQTWWVEGREFSSYGYTLEV